jgi:hypothetical protein
LSAGQGGDEIVRQLTAEFAVAEPELIAEASSLLAALESYGLVER